MNPIDCKTFIRTCLFVLGLLLLSGAHAQEGNCPPGYQPIGAEPGQDGPQGCAPTPGEEQQPPVRWASRWGAIATYEPNGSLGAATNESSQRKAEQVALADCQSKHGSVCKLETAYANGCGALVGSDTGYVVTTGNTLNEAIQSGMKTCTDAGYHNCHAYYTACSLPARIQ